MRLMLGTPLVLLIGATLYVIGHWRGFRHGYRLGRAQASTEEIDFLKRLSHPSRWAVNRDGEVLDLAGVKGRAR